MLDTHRVPEHQKEDSTVESALRQVGPFLGIGVGARWRLPSGGPPLLGRYQHCTTYCLR